VIEKNDTRSGAIEAPRACLPASLQGLGSASGCAEVSTLCLPVAMANRSRLPGILFGVV
jgi:hypothetical protein